MNPPTTPAVENQNEQPEVDPFAFYETDTPSAPPESEAPSAKSEEPAPVQPAVQEVAAPAPVQQVQQPPVQSAQPPVQQKEMTAEEVDRILRVHRATPELLNRIGLQGASDEQVRAYNEHIQAIVNNAVTVAHAMALKEMQGYRPQPDPRLEELYQRHQLAVEHEQRTQFFSEHKELEKYPEIVRIAAQEATNFFEASGVQPSVEQAKSKVVEVARSILSRSGISIAQQPSNQPRVSPATKTAKGAVPKMNSMLSPGRSSTSSGEQKADAFDIYKE
jgi:hypothetical protein